MEWRKATYSAENGNCVEVASAGAVMIRDSQNREGLTLAIPAEAWRAFAAQVRGRTSRPGHGTPIADLVRLKSAWQVKRSARRSAGSAACGPMHFQMFIIAAISDDCRPG
jgi:hypothetical protein